LSLIIIDIHLRSEVKGNSAHIKYSWSSSNSSFYTQIVSVDQE